MRLRCIKGNDFLTFGELYNVVETYQAHYVVIDDLDCNYIVPIDNFEDVYKMRNDKLEKLGI